MLANISSNVLLFLLISIFVIATVVVVGGTIWGILRARKNNLPNRKKTILISLFSIFIAAASWILNMGWIRFIMTFLLIPFIHAIIFFITNLFISAYADKSKDVKVISLLFCITYLLLYTFLPDAADYGEMYFFFGLVHSNLLSGIAQAISSIAFLGHVVLFVLQIVQVAKIKKSQADGNDI